VVVRFSVMPARGGGVGVWIRPSGRYVYVIV
jgi:hypothetical protein